MEYVASGLVLGLAEDGEEEVVVGDKKICVAGGEGECFLICYCLSSRGCCHRRWDRVWVVR